MNIYLDIDGVLLDKQGNPAKYLLEFLQYMTSHHSVFWLTTHCKGDNESLLSLMKRRVSPEVLFLMQKIQVTNWQTLKTEAIDFSQDFRWFDDSPMEAEKRVLSQNNCSIKLCVVDLKVKQDVLSSFIL